VIARFFSSLGKNSSKGFTLLEMALVVAIIGVLTSIMIPSIRQSIQIQRIKKTQEHQEFVIKALAQYTLAHGHLPCPSNLNSTTFTHTGHSNNGKAVHGCHNHIDGLISGHIPYGDLQISSQYAKDGEHRWMQYTVFPFLANHYIKLITQPVDPIPSKHPKSKSLTFCRITDNPLQSISIQNNNGEYIYQFTKEAPANPVAFVIESVPVHHVGNVIKEHPTMSWISRDLFVSHHLGKTCEDR
jgi:prepilin-type N-terminal cleavage/methylation domain-containing protein